MNIHRTTILVLALSTVITTITACSSDNGVNASRSNRTVPTTAAPATTVPVMTIPTTVPASPNKDSRKDCFSHGCGTTTTTPVINIDTTAVPTQEIDTPPPVPTNMPSYPPNYTSTPSQVNPLIWIVRNGPNVEGEDWLKVGNWGCGMVDWSKTDMMPFFSRDDMFPFEDNIVFIMKSWQPTFKDIWSDDDVSLMVANESSLFIRLPANLSSLEMEHRAVLLNDLLERDKPCG